MMIQYTLEMEKYNKLVEEKIIEGVEKVGAEYSTIEVSVDFSYNRVSVWGNTWWSSELFNDNATVNDIEKIEEESTNKVLDDIYVTNIEVTEYLETFGIPHEWALEAVGEWRNPEQEEEELNEEEFWETIEGIKAAWEISREEN